VSSASDAALLALSALCALAYIVVAARGIAGPVRWIKLGPALLAAVGAADRPLLAAGFVAWAVGDAFLLDKGRWFLAGLGAFLVGHVLVIVDLVGRLPPSPLGGGVGLVLAAGMLVALAPGLRGVLRAAVPVYALALAALLAATSALGPLGLVGGASFLLSDALIGWQRFRSPIPHGDTWVLTTYYLAVLSISAAAS